jgi:hypothetical protein
MTTTITTTTTELTTTAHSLTLAGQAANRAAQGLAFAEYLQSKTANTLKAQGVDLAHFAAFLQTAGIEDAPTGEMLQNDPAAWAGVTHGLVLAYREWCMAQGYSIATVNRRLATVKTYARLGAAHDAAIAGVRGFGHKAGRNRDAKRAESGTATRVGTNKPYKSVVLTYEQAQRSPTLPRGAGMPCCSVCCSTMGCVWARWRCWR